MSGETQLLQRWQAGDAEALSALIPQIYADLRRMAARELRGQQGHDTLQPTALVNDLFLRLLGTATPRFENRAHLFNTAARIMRQLLIDRARKSATFKHGGDWRRCDLDEALNLPLPDDETLPALDEALAQLQTLEPRLAQIVELRYFAGLSVAEVATVLALDERTVYRDWASARAWLRAELCV